jgi:hypothetical protein
MRDNPITAARTQSWEQVYARELLARLRNTPAEQMKDVYPFPAWLWEKLRHNGRRLKDQVVGHLPHDSRNARRLRAWQWEIDKASCPNWVPWVLYIQERQYTGLFGRTRQRVPTGSQPLLISRQPNEPKQKTYLTNSANEWARQRGDRTYVRHRDASVDETPTGRRSAATRPRSHQPGE